MLATQAYSGVYIQKLTVYGQVERAVNRSELLSSTSSCKHNSPQKVSFCKNANLYIQQTHNIMGMSLKSPQLVSQHMTCRGCFEERFLGHV